MKTNKIFKVILLSVIALVALLLVSSCDDGSPYGLYDGEGYGVSVKYDANGGTFTVGTSVIVDTYGLDSLPTRDGKKIAKLITPDNEAVRGKGNSFIPSKSGYTFVGWYAKRTESGNTNGTTTYTYADMWDFDKDRLELDPNKEYSANEPVLTLYAAWIPEFKFEFYSLTAPDTLLGEYEIAPYGEIDMPSWDTRTGKIKMFQFPTIEGRTFEAVYTDPNGENKLIGTKIKHAGTLNYDNATAVNPVMKLYIDTVEGEWMHIFSANQLGQISLDGNYVIENDLDFKYTDLLGKEKFYSWSSYLVSGKFTGQLIGKTKENGEPVRVKNISFTQSSGSAVYTVGMFGQIGDEAVISNIAFENTTMTIDVGAPLRSDVSFGLLAGTISESARLEGVSIEGTVKIDSAYSFKGGYSIGLVCGSGDRHGIDYSNITCEKTGEVDSFELQVTEDKVTLSRVGQ